MNLKKISIWAVVIISTTLIITKCVGALSCVLADETSPDRYHWLFDSAQLSNIRFENQDVNLKNSKYRFFYTYKNLYRYGIIEDSKFNGVSLNEIKYQVRTTPNKENIITSEGTELFSRRHIQIKSNLCTSLSNQIFLNFDKNSNIFQEHSSNTLFLEGTFENVIFQNDKKKDQYLFSYEKPTEGEILFYKPQNILYIIWISPLENLSDIHEGIKLLNLK